MRVSGALRIQFGGADGVLKVRAIVRDAVGVEIFTLTSNLTELERFYWNENMRVNSRKCDDLTHLSVLVNRVSLMVISVQFDAGDLSISCWHYFKPLLITVWTYRSCLGCCSVPIKAASYSATRCRSDLIYVLCIKKCRTFKVWVIVFLSGWEYRRESKGTKWRMRQGTQMRSWRRLQRTQRKKELIQNKNNLREIQLQFKLEIYCQARV